MTTSPAATRQDLDTFYVRFEGLFVDFIDNKLVPIIQRVVGETVGEIVGDALQHISERFDYQDGQIKGLRQDIDILKTDVSHLKIQVNNLETAMIRVENKLDITADTTDRHTFQIKALQRKTA